MATERKIFGIRIPRLLPDGDYSVFNRLGPKPLQEKTPEVKLTAKGKILEALGDLEKEGIPSVTPDQILNRVKQLHPSRLNVPYVPRWEKALSQLESSGEIVNMRNREYVENSPSNRLYRRANNSDTPKTGSSL